MDIKNLLIAACIIILSGCASTQRDPSIPIGLIYGKVTEVSKMPDRCKQKDNSTARGLIGAALGIAAGNQVGGGSGKDVAKVAGAIAGYQIGKNTNNEDDDLVVCKSRGWLVTISYKDNYGRERIVDRRYSNPRNVGDIIEFKL